MESDSDDMMLAFGSARQKEIAIRLAVGGTRSRIVRQLLVQGLLLSLAGGALGLLTATWAAQWLVSSMATVFPIFVALDLTPDTTVLVATMIFCSLATVAFGLCPARRLSRFRVLRALLERPGEVVSRARSQATQTQDDFADFLIKVDHAQAQVLNGRPDVFKSLWSHQNDVTLSGGAGGPVEKGWPAISERLDWVATQYSSGDSRIDRVAQNVGGNLGYVVQHEHLRFRVAADRTESTRDYRVTMIFRREAGAWRIVHRQADSN